MADSYSARLRLRLQATGNNTNTWGALLNTSVAQLLEDAICGMANVVVTTSDVTLSQNNGAQDQSRMALLNLTGAPTGPFNIIAPAIPKLYLVLNNTGQVMTVKTPGIGTGIAVAAATNQFLACDGTNIIAVQASASGTVANSLALGGIPAASYARLDIFNQFAAGFGMTFDTLADGGTITLDAHLSNCFFVKLAGNRTLAFTNEHDGQGIEVWVQQDASGSRTLAWPGNVQFEASSSNTLTSTPNAVDRFQLTYNLALDLWIARAGVGTASPGTTTLVLGANEMDVDVFTRAGSPGGVVTVNVVSAAGTIIQASSPATPALDFTGFATGSTINWTNLGYVLGCGGDGAQGAEGGQAGSTLTDLTAGKVGTDGGPAVKGPGGGRNFNITNGSGFIWGAGGGGGGGGASWSAGQNGNGGGGGGGVGGGRAGFGGAGDVSGGGAIGSNGKPGGGGRSATFGAGGAGNAHGGAGGAGGDWASGGAAGTAVSGGGATVPPGAGGAAGKAIDLAGGSASFVSGSGGPNVKGSVI